MLLRGMVETERHMIERHVELGERLIAEQKERMRGMRERGQPMAAAEALLAQLVETQSLHLEHLTGWSLRAVDCATSTRSWGISVGD